MNRYYTLTYCSPVGPGLYIVHASEVLYYLRGMLDAGWTVSRLSRAR